MPKVEKAADALGYSPNALASSLTTGRTKLIGLVSNNFHNPIFLEVFDLFTKGLQARGLRPLLVNLTDEAHPEGSIQMLRQYSVDGVIVASSTLPPTFSKAFREAQIPVVHSFGRFASAPDVHVVGISSQAAGHKTLAPQLVDALKAAGADETIVICGGVIPQQDYQFLYDAGVKAIFGPGTNIPDAAQEILTILRSDS